MGADFLWECEGCHTELRHLATSDQVMYESSQQCWICLKCSELKPKYVKILRKDRQGPERRQVERSRSPRP
jgi:hypothetical protein